MRKNTLKVLGLCAGLGFATLGNAAMIRDVVPGNQFVNYLDIVTWTHDINDDGFTLGTALSGSLQIELWDDDQCEHCSPECLLEALPEVAAIFVDQIDFEDGEAFYALSNGNWSGALGLSALDTLNGSGLLQITLWSEMGDFWLGDSTLTVETSEVPVPGTLGLLGVGLAGLALARRRGRSTEAV